MKKILLAASLAAVGALYFAAKVERERAERDLYAAAATAPGPTLLKQDLDAYPPA